MTDEAIYKLLAIGMSIPGLNGEYMDMGMFDNRLLMGSTISLVIEIDDLLNEGYTKDEITTFINECDFTKSYENITLEDAEYLRRYSLKLLEIRHRIYTEKNNNLQLIK